jgi:hypothetical protein
MGQPFAEVSLVALWRMADVSPASTANDFFAFSTNAVRLPSYNHNEKPLGR